MKLVERLKQLSDKIEDHAMACDELCGHYLPQLDAVAFVARQLLTPEEFADFYDCGGYDPDAAYARYNEEGKGAWFGGIYYLDDPSVPLELINE